VDYEFFDLHIEIAGRVGFFLISIENMHKFFLCKTNRRQ